MRAALGVGQSGFLHRTTGCKYIDEWSPWNSHSGLSGGRSASRGREKARVVYIHPMRGRIWRFCGKILVSKTMKEFMRAVAVCALLAFVAWTSGCSSSNAPNAQNDASGVWQAALSGGDGTASGFSFVTQFAVGTNGALSVTNFQFLNNNQGACFPVTGATPSGTFMLSINSADQLTDSTFSFTVTANGNTLTLTSTSVTGTATGSVISGGTVLGTWVLQGTSTGCTAASGSFTMTQSSTTSSST
jgi:hypothetical protein